MKCKYCNAEVTPNARFCTTCGGDLSKFDKCVNCGEFIDKGKSTCPHCGTQQPHEEKVEVKVNGSKKWLLILPIIVLLVGVGTWYFYSDRISFKGSTDSIEAVDSTPLPPIDIHSVDGVEERLYEIFYNGFKMQDDEAVNKYFSEEFRILYKKVDEIDSNSGGIGFWEGNIWDGGQDGNPTSFEILNVEMPSATTASFVANFQYHTDDYHSAHKISMSAVFENGNWFIDENNDWKFKQRMKEYVNDNANDNDSPISFVDKIYKGNGNGGGTATKMTISFLDNKKCLCESDWYQTFSSPKTFQGTYSTDGKKLIVRCSVDGTKYEFNFDVKSNGRIIEFDNSDPNMGGSMGTDIMSLELQNR